jgi:DNA repair protein SbcD/Mre11
MRVFHTSDWHLGRTFHGVDLIGAQSAYVDHLVDLVRAESVGLVAVSGDIYDRALPGVDAVSLCDEALARLADTGALVVVISGNHDSARRLGFGSRLMTRAGVHVRSDVRRAAEPILVPLADGGELAVYAIPYLEPDAVRPLLGAGIGRGHEAVLRAMVGTCRADLERRPASRSIILAHAFVHGGEASASERDISVGGASEVPLSLFDDFDYVALGHLHGRQILSEAVRYSGSPIAYSFSERHHTKGGWLLDIDSSGRRRVEFVSAPVARPLAVLTGTLDELMSSADYDGYAGHFVSVTLTDAGRVDDAMTRLQRRFPHAVHLEWRPATAAAAGDRSYGERVTGREPADIVAEFIGHVRGTPPDAAELEVISAAVEQQRRAGDEQLADVVEAVDPIVAGDDTLLATA